MDIWGEHEGGGCGGPTALQEPGRVLQTQAQTTGPARVRLALRGKWTRFKTNSVVHGVFYTQQSVILEQTDVAHHITYCMWQLHDLPCSTCIYFSFPFLFMQRNMQFFMYQQRFVIVYAFCFL